MGLLDLLSRKYSLQESGILSGSVDRHSHILHGVDDGIKQIEDSLAVLRFEESMGVKEVWCTPHVMEDVPNTTESLKARFDELCAAYSGPVRLHLAAEYMLDTLLESRLEADDLLTMEDDLLLVETSTVAAPYGMKSILGDILSKGYRPLLAHPERYRYLDPKDYETIFSMGVRFQLNIGSLTGYYGSSAKSRAEWLLSNDMYSVYGSDCHRLKAICNQYRTKILTKDIITRLTKLNICQD